jgi:lysophospholipase L1-like esterase
VTSRTRAVVTLNLDTALRQSQTVTFAYPTGTDASTWAGGAHSVLVAQAPRVSGVDFLLLFGALGVTLHWLAAGTLSAGSVVQVALAAPDAADTALPAYILSRPGLIRSQAPYLRGSGSTSSNHTFHTTWAVECDFDLVRLVYHTDQLAGWTVNAAAVAPSAKLNNGYDPVTSADAAVPWTAVTFHAAGADGLAPSPAGAATQLDIPASAATTLNTFVFTDWVRCSSLDRVDAGSDGRPLLMVRSFGSAAGRRASPSMAAWNTEDEGRALRAFYKSGGDYTTSGFTSPTEDNSFVSPCAVQYYGRRRGATVVSAGDSLTQGTADHERNPYSWGHYATAALSSRDRPVAFVNGGWHGSTSAEFLANARNYVDVFRADILTLSVWTPNDTRTQAAADIAWQNVMEVAHYAISKGAIPVLATAIPYGLSLADDTVRKAINDRARAMAATGAVLLADLDAAVTDGASPARVNAILRASGSHLTPTGYRAMAAAAMPVIARALSALGFSR